MEHARASPQSGCLCQLVGKAHSWVDVVMVADVRLAFVPGAQREVELLSHLPIALKERAIFELVDVQPGIALGPCKGRRPAGGDCAGTWVGFRFCGIENWGIQARAPECSYQIV